MITITCPQCKNTFEANQTIIGKQARCAFCGNVFIASLVDLEKIKDINQAKCYKKSKLPILNTIKASEGLELHNDPKYRHEKFIGLFFGAIIIAIIFIIFPPSSMLMIVLLPVFLIKQYNLRKKSYMEWNQVRRKALSNADLFDAAKKLGNKENGYAQNYIGVCYALGKGVEKDFQEAYKWFRKADQADCYDANCNLGRCHYLGEGTKQNSKKAFTCFKLASNLTEAQYNLGVCYYLGTGVQQNFSEAFKCFQLAPERGLPEAQYNLGICLYNGVGPSDKVSDAQYWWHKAAEQGLKEAQDILRSIFL